MPILQVGKLRPSAAPFHRHHETPPYYAKCTPHSPSNDIQHLSLTERSGEGQSYDF